MDLLAIYFPVWVKPLNVIIHKRGMAKLLERAKHKHALVELGVIRL